MSFQFSRLQASTAPQARRSTSRAPIDAADSNDPLQPLRTMAERVGKEVEKFAERVDHWHLHGNESAEAKYQTTVRMVDRFRELAKGSVNDLKRQSDSANQGDLDRSVRRRIQRMADQPDPYADGQQGGSVESFARSTMEPTSSEVNELRQWETELATWELLRVIIEHYHPRPGTDVVREKQARLARVGGAERYSPNHEVWDRFLLEDDAAKEKEIVLRWLEQSARNTGSDIQAIVGQLEAESGKETETWTSGWLETRAKIKQEKRMRRLDRPINPNEPVAQNLRNSDKTSLLVSQLDPDVTVRQKRTLEKSDEYYERALWMVLYEMIRRGEPWDKICDWCKERSEQWRGISIGAASGSHPEGGPSLSGPTVGFLFRRMCDYASAGSQRAYEQAVYGLLGGNLKSVEAVCRSWDDHLYARYTSLLLSRFDNYLIYNTPRVDEKLARKFIFHDAAAELGDWTDSSRLVIDLLQQQKSTANQASAPLKLIQGSLISRDVESVLFNVGLAILTLLDKDQRPTNLILSPDGDATDPRPMTIDNKPITSVDSRFKTLATHEHGLRVLVHVFLVLWHGLKAYPDTTATHVVAIDNVICAYIEFLRLSRRIQLIPVYAAQLDKDRQIHCLARILPDVTNSQEQQRFINLTNRYDLGPRAIVQQNFSLVLQSSGLADRKKTPVTRYQVLEPTSAAEVLWPGKRIQSEFTNMDVRPEEEALLRALQWYPHLEKEVNHTFTNLADALRYFLLHGRLGAAVKLIDEMSLESLSLIKTEAICGIGIDIMSPEADDFHEHAQKVFELRHLSKTYWDLQQLVRILIFFRDWREEEEHLIQQKSAGDGKVDLSRIKELYTAITESIDALLASFLTQSATGRSLAGIPDTLPPDADAYSTRLFNERADFISLKKIYVPEVLIAYLTVIQAASYFVTKEHSLKAMELATVIADKDNEWIQNAFLESGRMGEFMDGLARVSKTMLVLSEQDKRGKKSGKLGKHGETVKVWDINVRN